MDVAYLKATGRLSRVKIKDGWHDAGKEGFIIGEEALIGQYWTPVLWDGDDDPDWHKSAGLERIVKTIGFETPTHERE